MNFKILLMSIAFFVYSDPLKIDLGEENEYQYWYVINDGVMGGLSKGTVESKTEYIRFSGKLSLENNGGFSWVKSSSTEIDLSDYSHVRLKVRGEGRDYDFTLEDNSGSMVLYFKHTFQTEKGKWTIVELPLKDFKQKYFGQFTGRSLGENELITRMGFLLNDKNIGAFQLDADYIEFFNK